jgi:hypothetical protein
MDTVCLVGAAIGERQPVSEAVFLAVPSEMLNAAPRSRAMGWTQKVPLSPTVPAWPAEKVEDVSSWYC